MIEFSKKQKEFWRCANHRWNVKSGATRSGKTYLDYYVIPKRIRDVANKDGLIVLLGNTKGTLQRNVIEPLQRIWSTSLVSDIRSDNTAVLFGEKCYCLGADKVNQVDRIRGSSIKYCYGDEIVTWHEEVFQMLKSRLDKPYSHFDGTCNPDSPMHWFKKFLDSDADIYLQEYRIDDNPFLPPEFVANLKKEYEGTVYYDRFILGLWKTADGLIYRQFADDPEKWMIPDMTEPKDHSGAWTNEELKAREFCSKIDFISIGIDFGGNRSLTTFVATAVMRNYSELVVLRDYHIKGTKGEIDANRLSRELISFLKKLQSDYPSAYIRYCFADCAEQYLITTLRKALLAAGLNIPVGDSDKNAITSRIICTNTLLNTNRLHLLRGCDLLRAGLEGAVWDNKAAEKGEDKRLDDFTSDIDILDAFEYSFERFMRKLVK